MRLNWNKLSIHDAENESLKYNYDMPSLILALWGLVAVDGCHGILASIGQPVVALKTKMNFVYNYVRKLKHRLIYSV